MSHAPAWLSLFPDDVLPTTTRIDPGNSRAHIGVVRLIVLGERLRGEPRDNFHAALLAFPQIGFPQFVGPSVFHEFFDGDAVLFRPHEPATATEVIRGGRHYHRASRRDSRWACIRCNRRPGDRRLSRKTIRRITPCPSDKNRRYCRRRHTEPPREFDTRCQPRFTTAPVIAASVRVQSAFVGADPIRSIGACIPC